MPFYLNRADLCTVEDGAEGFATKFCGDLLQGQLFCQLQVSDQALDRLRHLFFESKNFEKVYGAKAFGLGFPLWLDTLNTDLIVAPVFVWKLTMEPAKSTHDSWVIKFGETNHLQPNYKLFSFLQEKYGLNMAQEAERLAKAPGALAIPEFARQLAERLNFEVVGGADALQPTPGIDKIGKLSEAGALHWAGVLGLYPPQNYRWVPTDAKPEHLFVAERLDADKSPVLPCRPIDPEQASALENMARYKCTVMEGEDQAGKTETIVNLLVQSLLDGEKCLVVSERTPALRYTQHLLSRAGYDSLNYLLDDEFTDRDPMLDLLRISATALAQRQLPSQEASFQQKISKYHREKAKFDAAYSAVKSKIFGDSDWTETVGMFLANNKLEGKELLATQLNAQDFSYTTVEQQTILQGISSSRPLFNGVKSLSHPLSNLHDTNFESGTPKDGLKNVVAKLSEQIAKSASLRQQYISYLDGYAVRLKDYYYEHFDRLLVQVNALKDAMIRHGEALGNDFWQAGVGGFNLFSLFSSKKGKVKQAQEEISKLYRQLIKLHSSNPYFSFQDAPSKDGMHIAKTTANIKHFEESLRAWQGHIDTQVQDEIQRLNSKTAHPQLDAKEQVTELEYSLEVFLDELNQAKLYGKPFENKTLTITQRLKYLEGVIEQLEGTQLNLRDFDPFFAWHSNWLKMSPLAQKVVRALVKSKANNWVAAFESWYFGNLLSKSQSPELPVDTVLIEATATAWQELQPMIQGQISAVWKVKQDQAIRDLKRKNRKTHTLLFEKQRSKKNEALLLSDIMAEAIDCVTCIFPVLFVTPHVAKNVIPSLPGYFDTLVIDEAGASSVENPTHIAHLGKRVVICGRNVGNGAETSLLQYALENGVPSISITNQYEPPKLPSISTEPYGEPALYHATQFVSENVEGRFHEMENTNDVEAQHITRLLNQIKQTPKRVYPSVGIVTLTIEQRDLIALYLLKLKQQNSAGGEKIQQLERNGMGVYQIDEVHGFQFDIIILSCTYGTVNLKGELAKKIASLNSPTQLNNLSMLVNKPSQQFFLVHSLPEPDLEQYYIKKWDKGTWLIANLVKAAEAQKNGNNELLEVSLQAIGRVGTPERSGSLFLDEVAKELTPYISEKRIQQQVTVNGVYAPLCIRPLYPGQPPVVLYPDGFLAQTPFGSAIWEQGQASLLQKAGLVLMPVWSATWLKNPSHEAKLLASKIIKFDAQYQLSAIEK